MSDFLCFVRMNPTTSSAGMTHLFVMVSERFSFLEIIVLAKKCHKINEKPSTVMEPKHMLHRRRRFPMGICGYVHRVPVIRNVRSCVCRRTPDGVS